MSVRNDGSRARDVSVELVSGKTNLGTKSLKVAAGQDASAAFTFKLADAGLLQARVRSADNREDAFPQDDRVALDLPAETTARIVVYTNDPGALQPLLAGHPQFEAKFEPTARYDPSVQADILVFDRFAPQQAPNRNILWIDPPPGSPFAVRTMQANAKLERWNAESPLAAGLSTKDVEIATTKVFEPARKAISPSPKPLADLW